MRTHLSTVLSSPHQPIHHHWLVVIFIENFLWNRWRRVLLWFLRTHMGGSTVRTVAILLIQVNGSVLHPCAQGPPLRSAGAELAVEDTRMMGGFVGAQLDSTVGKAEFYMGIFELLHRFIQGVFNADVTRRHCNLLHHLGIKYVYVMDPLTCKIKVVLLLSN